MTRPAIATVIFLNYSYDRPDGLRGDYLLQGNAIVDDWRLSDQPASFVNRNF